MSRKHQRGFAPIILLLIIAIGGAIYFTKSWEKLRTLLSTITSNTPALAVSPEPITLNLKSTSDPSTGIIRSISNTWPPTSTGNIVVGEATDGNSIVTYLAAGSYFVHRGYISFDTTSIPNDATILSASINLHVSETAFSNDDNTTLEIVAATQGETLTTADYDNIGSVSFASAPLASLTKNSYNTLTLNQNGLAAINKGGITQLGLRIGLDLQGVAPSNINQFFTALNDSETVGIRLNITYKLPNNTPVAAAGTSLTSNGRLQLDGSLSSDPDGTIASYSWQIDGEASPRTGQTASIADLKKGNYKVTLTVTDDKGATNSDTMLFGITTFTGNPQGGTTR